MQRKRAGAVGRMRMQFIDERLQIEKRRKEKHKKQQKQKMGKSEFRERLMKDVAK